MAARADRFAEHVPRDARSPWYGEHLARYRLAAGRVAGRRVLDMACGPGIGAAELVAGGATSVVGADLDADALAEARAAGHHAVLCADAGALPFPGGAFDVIACFETLEHVGPDVAAVAELARVLAPGGTLYLSTPNALVTKPVDGRPRNPFHVREYEPSALRRLLDERFADVSLLGQLPSGPHAGCGFWRRPPGLRGMLAWAWMRVAVRLPSGAVDAVAAVRRRPVFPGPDDFTFTADGLERAHALLAVCRGPRP